MGAAPQKKRREDLSPMDQEIYDVAKDLSPYDPKTYGQYSKRVEEIKKRWAAPPPTPPDLTDEYVLKAANLERQKRMKSGSARASFLTGQDADTFLTNPKTLLSGG